MPRNIPVRKIFFILFPISLIFAILLLFIFSNSQKEKLVTKRTSLQELLKEHESKEPEKVTYNILLLGYGGGGHSGGGLADAEIVVSINISDKKISLIALPRDMWVNLPVRSDLSQHYKINNAFAIGASEILVTNKQTEYSGPHGGGNLAMKAAEIVTGLKIDHYFAVDFSRFIKSIDALDGITVNVPVTFNDYFYPVKGLENESCGLSPEMISEFHQKYSGFELEKQFTCRYEHLHFDKGQVEMNGETALKFIRSRHSDEHGGDFARGVREQVVIFGIKDKLLSLNALDNIDEFYEEFRRLIITDIEQEEIVELLAKFGSPSDYGISTLNITADNYLENGTSSDGQYILTPKAGMDNWGQIQNYIKQNI